MADTRKFVMTATDGTVVHGEALADGRVKFTTGDVGPTVHASLEAALKQINNLLGGESTRTARGDVAQSHHHHSQEGEHTHGH